jgi:hypothetical protein
MIAHYKNHLSTEWARWDPHMFMLRELVLINECRVSTAHRNLNFKAKLQVLNNFT